MAGKNTGVSTRRKGAIKFSGLPSPLDETEPRICQQIIQYSYFLMNNYRHLSCLDISQLIAKDVIDIWKAVNPRLLLLKEISVVNKVKILCFQKAKQISMKHLPAAQTKFWKEKLDTFLDISSCSCNLPILNCDNINVKCNKENCQTKHIICTCPLTKKPTKSIKISPPIASTLYVQGDSSQSYSSSPSDETEDYKQLDSPLQVPYNLKKIPRYALELGVIYFLILEPALPMPRSWI